MIELMIIKNGSKYWWQGGVLHRSGGPAIIVGNNHEWWWHGEPVGEFALMILAAQEISYV